ncbi:DsbA family protein [Thalassospira sp. GB04J01]|uniref:DsbA family protein n=1 Tax=Thalassospira sp. GB04J01 TaxID=1485225 RepID=UPI000C9A1FFA|nr:DsbA family protein [Thalassospira sp. GB04J01]|tara:strand:+ start:52934 stop:53572 length:639 start_codon:yes stop_codon:yes gene_type:complete
MQLSYLYDPLCGWCYGALPAMTRLSKLPDVSVTLLPTGLFAGHGARVMDENFASYAWKNDQRIAKLTGQVFSTAYQNNVLKTPGGSFDSGPAGLALTAVQMTAPKHTLTVLKAFQNARYVDGLDNTNNDILIKILRDFDLASAADLFAHPTNELHATYQDTTQEAQRLMQRFGLNGVPSLLIETASGPKQVASNLLYGDVDHLSQELKALCA